MSPIAAWMPLSHSVPDLRLERPSTVPRHKPAEGLPVTGDGREAMAPGVCTYLGAPCRRYQRPDRQPVLAYLFTAEAIDAAAEAFPCDHGGFVIDSPGVDTRAAIGTHAEARAWVRTLLGAAGSLRAFLSWDWEPPATALHPLLRGYARVSDPASFTPEVRAGRPLTIARDHVHVALIGMPTATSAPDRLRALVDGIGDTYAALDDLEIETEPFHGEWTEAPYRALHRAAADWISGHAPPGAP